MDFSFSKEEVLLQKSVRDFLEKECKDIARESEETGEGYSKAIWERMAELGWMGIGFPDEYGGMGGSFLELVILLEEMGRVLLPGPFIQCVICSGLVILEYGSEAQKKEYLPGLVEGRILTVPALETPSSYAGEPAISESLEIKNGNFILSGTRLFVPFAHMANGFLVRTRGNNDQEMLLFVESKSPGIKIRVLDSIDSGRWCELVMDKVKVPVDNIIGKADAGEKAVKRSKNLGAISHAAFILGMLEKVLDMTTRYAKERMQFERPIGSFQAIKHQIADMSIYVEQVKYLTYHAVWKISQHMPADMEISMAKARASDASRRVCLLGVKIHGGIGIIDEYDLQLYFRRAKANELAFGDGDYHREMVAANFLRS